MRRGAPTHVRPGGDVQDPDRPVRVLIVDDSPTMRKLIRVGLEHDPGIQVIAEAGTAREARDHVKALVPDVLTLDVEMPGMDGLEFLARLMRARPMPVVMISSLTARGSDAALRALSLGAIDCFEKPRFGEAHETFTRLGEILKVAAAARVRGSRPERPPPPKPAPGFHWNGKLVLVGSSTGGVEALETLLAGFSADCPPTLITQHMPAQFLVNFAARLDAAMAPSVSLARDGAPLAPGQILLSPGDIHLELAPDGTSVRLVEAPKTSGHRPSVDRLFASAVPRAGDVVAAILTGMGRDGAEGMQALHEAGAYCIGQDEESCVVYGMPKQAKLLGGVDIELPLARIAGEVLAQTSRSPEV